MVDEQTRALKIRRTTLSIADAIQQLIEDPTIQNDPTREAELTAQYWQGMLDLQDLGIKAGMHVGDPPNSFDNPTKVAEYTAGQVVGIEGDKLPNIRQALMQTQEHSEGTYNVGGINVHVMPTDKISPTLKNFIALRSMVNVICRFLASDLDQSK